MSINPGVVAAICVAGVRGNMYTCYTYCCHNTGIDRQDFKFSVF